MIPTEDYPGPSKSHREKEDTNVPPRPANVDPERPPLPNQEEPPSQRKRRSENLLNIPTTLGWNENCVSSGVDPHR
jgi:hypothetical protein